MNTTYRKMAGAAGLVMVVLWIAFVALLGNAPEMNAAPSAIAGYFSSSQAALQWSIFLFLISTPFFLFFASGLLKILRESDAQWGENFEFGAAAGIIGTAALIVVQSAANGLLTSGLLGTANAAQVSTIYAFAQLLHPASGVFLVLWYACVAIPGIRHKILPAAICWLAVVVGVVEVIYATATVSVGGIAPQVNFDMVEGGVSIIWIIAVCVWLLAGRAEKVAPVSAAAPARA